MSTSVVNDSNSDRTLEHPRSSSDHRSARAWLWDVVLLLLPIIGLFPLLVLHGFQLWSRPAFQFFPVVILVLVFGFILAQKDLCLSKGRRLFGFASALIGFALAFYAAWIFTPSIACISLSSLLIAWGAFRLPNSSIGRLLTLGFFVISLVPLPLNLDIRVENALSNTAASLASNVLDVFQVFHLLQSPYMAIETTTINFIDLLSNAFSIRAVMSLVLFLVIIRRRAFLAGVMAFCTGIGCALVGKMLLLTGAVLMANSGIAWNEGIVWSILPWGVAIFAMILISAMEATWGALFEPIRTSGEVLSIDRTRSANLYNRIAYWPGTIVERRSRDSSYQTEVSNLSGAPSILWGMLAIAVSLLVVPLAMAVHKQRLLINTLNRVVLASDRTPDGKTISPTIFPGLRLNQYHSNSTNTINRGINIHLWSYSGIDSDAKIALLFPVGGWNSSWALGAEDGWEPQSKNDSSLVNPWPFLEKTLVSSMGDREKFAKFFSCGFTLEGKPYIPTAQELVDSPADAPSSRLLEPRLLNYLKEAPEENFGKTFIVQMQFETSEQLREEDQEMLRKIYFSVRESILKKIAGNE